VRGAGEMGIDRITGWGFGLRPLQGRTEEAEIHE